MIRREIVSMTSSLDVTVAVNMVSGAIDVFPSAKPTRDRVQACAPAVGRTSPPREMAV
jgi:hypothetical protein